MSAQAVWEHYRCPETFFDFVLDGELSPEEGYFRFGPNTTCYGRSCSKTSGTRPGLFPDDLLPCVVTGNAQLRLRFDPTEIIENFRLERYRRNSLTWYENVLKRIYYQVRPLTNRFIREQIQRIHMRNWQEVTFPNWPVDTTVENLCEKLMMLSMEAKGLDRVPFIWFWPNGAKGCVTMTHDVETAQGRDFCGELMDVDESFGIKASFQIVPEERYAVSSAFIDSIHGRGFEVGVQDLNHDGQLYDSRTKFLRRVGLINHYGREYGARGFRAGVLYRKPEWYGALDFAFDMSIPNVAHLDPQRGGCCTVMPYFIGDILELPVTTTQDYALFHLLRDYSIDLWRKQLGLILQKCGLASFIVHPDYLMKARARSTYQALLGYLRELRLRENLWFALPSEIDRWWRARSRMLVMNEGGRFRIEGEGAEHATLAFARNEDGQLKYEFAQSASDVETGFHA
jgi:hypothetical protein